MNTMSLPEYGLEPGLRFACVLDGRGGAVVRNWVEVRGWQPGDGVLWIHLERDDPEAQTWIRSESRLDPVVAEALLADDTRPRVEVVGEGLLIILRGISRIAEHSESELGGNIDYVPLHLWIDGQRVITLRDGDHSLMALRDLRMALAAGAGVVRPGELLARIAERLVADLEPVLEKMDDEVDSLEDAVLEKADAGTVRIMDPTANQEVRHRLSDLRRQAIHLRRYLTPQRDALNRLQREECDWLTQRDRVLVREDIDKLHRFIEYLDAIRDRAIILHEDLSALVSERIAFSSMRISKASNRLTALAAVVLPPSLIAGLWGMNVGGVPLNQEPLGFLYMGGVCAASMVLVLVLMRLLKWL
jgi:zinc transporter